MSQDFAQWQSNNDRFLAAALAWLHLLLTQLANGERIVNYLKGLNYLDDRLDPLLVPFDVVPDGVELPDSQRQVVALAKLHLEQAAAIGRPPVIQLLGTDGLSKQLVAWQTAADLGLQL